MLRFAFSVLMLIALALQSGVGSDFRAAKNVEMTASAHVSHSTGHVQETEKEPCEYEHGTPCCASMVGHCGAGLPEGDTDGIRHPALGADQRHVGQGDVSLVGTTFEADPPPPRV